MTAAGPLRVWREREDRLLRIRLSRPKANILDSAMVAALDDAFAAAVRPSPGLPALRGVLLDAEGPNFSFGASVEEHLPEKFEAMLRGFHALVLRVLELPIPVLVVVKGQCLGGGLELASAGGVIFAGPDTKLGQPEIVLGVFAPAASCLLPERIGFAAAEELLLSGRSVDATEALRIGLVRAVEANPEGAALAWFDENLANKSASSLRFAVRASRAGLVERVRAKLAALEAMYASELMPTRGCPGRAERVHRQAARAVGGLLIMIGSTKTTAAIVARCQALFDDLEFKSAREWKAAKPGRHVVAYMPIYVPRELIHAAGMLPLGILGAGENLEVIHGDAYYQSYICRIPRSTLELGVTGRLDFVDGFLFPSICDVIRNLSGIWKLLFPKVYVRYFDVPQNFSDAIGGEYYVQELKELREGLAKLGGVEITDDALRASIALYNENRRLVREVYAARAKAPWLAPASEVYLVMRAGMVLPVEEHTELLRDYLAAVRAEPRPQRDNCRIVLNGVFCEQPPLNLIKAIEMSGCYIVDDDFMLVNQWLLDDVPTTGEPLRELSSAFLHRSVETSAKYQPDQALKGKFLVDSVREKAAEGVIFAAPSFCDPALLDRPMLESALDRVDVPHIGFKYAENSAQMQPVREQAGTFADSIKLWSAP